MSKYVLSTMTANVAYHFYNMVGDLPVPDQKRKIRIFGGAGIPSETSGIGHLSRDDEGKPMWTPSGVISTISDEQYERLKEHPVFKKHFDAGYVKFVNGDISYSTKQVDKAVSGMNRDGFQQLNKETIESRVKITVGRKEDDDFRL